MASSIDVMRELEALHPPAGMGDLLPKAPDDQKTYELELKQLELCIQGLPSLSAAAMSPWTFELIKQVALGEDSSILSAILKMFNLMLSGRGGEAERWTASRLVALRKPNGKIRPIAVGDVWLRLLGKCVAKGKAADAGDKLAPLNLGVGIPGGAEIVVHAANLYARLLRSRDAGSIPLAVDEDPLCLLATDFSNAFNTLSRREMADAIKERFPDLLPFFNWSYGHAADLRLGTGFLVCSSSTGVRQGDPLGPLFFCLGIQRVLEEMARDHPDVHFMFYLDDGTLFGTRSKLTSAFFDFKERCAKIGLILNTDKSVGWDPTIDNDKTQREGINWVRDGVKILGGPIGGALSGPAGKEETYASAFAADQLGGFAKVLPLLRHLPATTAFNLANVCVNARPTYLARTIEPSKFADAASTFDDSIDDTLAVIVGWDGPLPAKAKRVRGLPRTEGGCSLRRMVSCSEPAFAASFIHAANVIHREHRWLWELVLEFNLLGAEQGLLKRLVPNFLGFSDTGINFLPIEDAAALPVACITAAQLYDAYVEQVVARDGDAPTSSSGRYLPALSDETMRAIADQEDGRLPRGLRQKDLQAPLDTAEQQAIATLLVDHQPGLAAMFLSGKCDPSGGWMRSDALADRRYTKIDDLSLTTNLRMRLLLPLHNVLTMRTCPCEKKNPFLVPGRDDYHAVECGMPGSATLINKRHNRVRDILANLLPNLLQGQGRVTVVKEKEYESVAKAGKPLWEIDVELSFVSVDFGAATFLLDVAVTHPGGATHLSGGSNRKAGAAALATERRKERQWNKILGHKRAGVTFVPFVVETGGFLGKKAVAFLDLICGVTKEGNAKLARGRTHIIRAILTSIAISNRDLCTFHRSKVREIGRHYPHPPTRAHRRLARRCTRGHGRPSQPGLRPGLRRRIHGEGTRLHCPRPPFRPFPHPTRPRGRGHGPHGQFPRLLGPVQNLSPTLHGHRHQLVHQNSRYTWRGGGTRRGEGVP